MVPLRTGFVTWLRLSPTCTHIWYKRIGSNMLMITQKAAAKVSKTGETTVMLSKQYSQWSFLLLFNFHHNCFREWSSVNCSAVSPIRRNEGLSEGEREREGEKGKCSKLSVNKEETEHGTQEWGNELNNGTRLPVPSELFGPAAT